MNLKRLNNLAALAHLGSFLSVFFLFRRYPNAIKTVQLYRPAIDTTDPPDECNLSNSVVTKNAGQISFEYSIYLFFLISFAAHLFYANSEKYTQAIAKRWNPYRWFEYALSAGVMTLILAPADGTRDLAHVATLTVITGALQFCGLIVESALRNNDPLVVKTATGIGWILFISVFGSIFYNFANLKRDIDTGNEQGTFSPAIDLPKWLWFILLSQFFYYALFGLNQLSFIRNPKNFASVEYRYILLSFMAKLSLAAGFAYGLIYRTKDC
jgi:hypothetical protein